MNEFEIVQARLEQVPEITKLLNAAYKELADLGLNYTATFQDDEKTKERMSKGRCFVLIDSNKRILGTILITVENYFTARKTAYIGQFGILPEFKNKGLGTRLMHFCESLAAREGFDGIQLDTAIPAKHLVNWYLKIGYHVVGKEHYEGKTYDSYVFEKIFSEKFVIAKARPSDIERIAFVNSQSWQTTYVGIIGENFLKTITPEQQLSRAKRLVESNDLICLVAKSHLEGQVFGFAVFGNNREKNVDADCELQGIYLLKEFQKLGAGKRLFAEGVRQLKELGRTKMMVSVFEDNHQARAFYEKCGGDLIGNDHVDLDGVRYRTSTYIWQL